MSLTMPLTIGGKPYRQLHDGSGGVSTNEDIVGEAEEVIVVAWADRLDVRDYLIVGRAQHPIYSYLLCSNVKIDPLGKPTAANAWQYAKLTCTYKTFPYNAISMDFREENVEVAGDVQIDDTGSWVVSGGEPDAGKAVEGAVARQTKFLRYKVTRYLISTLPVSAVQLFGQVNNATFKGFAAYTVLYEGFTSSRKSTTAGTGKWTLNHSFLVGPWDLRKQWINGKLQLIQNSVTGEYKYTDGDFSTLPV